MKKRKKGRALSRKKGPRKALLASLAKALIDKEKVRMTNAKAKEVSPFVQKLITKAKKGDLAAQRHIASVLGPELAKKLVHDLAPRFQQRQGGYTRILKLGRRESNGAAMAIIELVT